MHNLVLILLLIFAGVALMVVLGERFGGNPDPQKLARLQRWILPLVGLALVLSLASHYLR